MLRFWADLRRAPHPLQSVDESWSHQREESMYLQSEMGIWHLAQLCKKFSGLERRSNKHTTLWFGNHFGQEERVRWRKASSWIASLELWNPNMHCVTIKCVSEKRVLFAASTHLSSSGQTLSLCIQWFFYHRVKFQEVKGGLGKQWSLKQSSTHQEVRTHIW